MRCSACTGKTDVVDTRHYTNAVKRKRVCRNCKRTFVTHESELALGEMSRRMMEALATQVARTKALEGEMYHLVQALIEVVDGGQEQRGNARQYRVAVPDVLRQKRPWSTEDLAKLDDLYPSYGARVVAARLGRSLSSVRAKAHERGLRLARGIGAIRTELEGNIDG